MQQKRLDCRQCSFIAFCLPDSDPVPATGMLTRAVKQQQKIQSRKIISAYRQPLTSLFVVKSGVLKASILELEGRERIIGFYLPGEILGLEAIYQQTYPFVVTTLKESLLCNIPYPGLLSVIAKEPNLQQQLLQLSSQRINTSNYISYLRAEQRVAGFLLELAERLNCQISRPQFLLPVSRQAIANYLGLATETIIRIINQFQQQDILAVHNKLISLKHLAKLQWLKQGGLLQNFNAEGQFS